MKLRKLLFPVTLLALVFTAFSTTNCGEPPKKVAIQVFLSATTGGNIQTQITSYLSAHNIDVTASEIKHFAINISTESSGWIDSGIISIQSGLASYSVQALTQKIELVEGWYFHGYDNRDAEPDQLQPSYEVFTTNPYTNWNGGTVKFRAGADYGDRVEEIELSLIWKIANT